MPDRAIRCPRQASRWACRSPAELVRWRSAPGQLGAALEERLHVHRAEGFLGRHVDVGQDGDDVVVDAVALAVEVEPVEIAESLRRDQRRDRPDRDALGAAVDRDVLLTGSLSSNAFTARTSSRSFCTSVLMPLVKNHSNNPITTMEPKPMLTA